VGKASHRLKGPRDVCEQGRLAGQQGMNFEYCTAKGGGVETETLFMVGMGHLMLEDCPATLDYQERLAMRGNSGM